MSETAPVYSLASDCNDLIQACSSPARNAGPLMENLLDEYERRFVACWQSLNNSASNEMSLDLKLQNHPTIRDILLRLLMIMQINLNQLQQYLRNQASHTHSYARDSNARKLDPAKIALTAIPETVEDTLKAIEDALKELGHLSAALRESRKSSESKRALAFAAAHYDSTHFERMAFLVVETLYPKAPVALQWQLSRSMADRNLRLNYRAFQNGKFRRFNKSSSLSGNHLDDSHRRNAGNSVASQINGPEGTTSNNAAHGPGHQNKSTGQSSLVTAKVEQLKNAHQTKSRFGATTAVLSYSVPPLPDFAGNDDVQCQWCFSTIFKTYVNNGKWTSFGRKHYLADLEPYVCISEECSESLPTFSSARMWKAHMESHGTMWRYNFDHHETGNSPSSADHHQEQVGAVHHDRHRQPDAISDDDAVANFSRPTDIDGCPVCGHTIDGPDVRTVVQDSSMKDDRTTGAPKRPGEQQTNSSTKRVRVSKATGSKGKAPTVDDQSKHSSITALEKHVLAHLEFLMVLSLKLGDNEDPVSGSEDEDDKSKTVEVSHDSSQEAEHLDDRSLGDMSSLPSSTSSRDSSPGSDVKGPDLPETDFLWSNVLAESGPSFPYTADDDDILKHIREKQYLRTPYVWDYVPRYRLGPEGLVRYLHDIFTADSYRKHIKIESFDEDHYRVYIPRQLTKEEKSPYLIERYWWAKNDDNPFA